MKATLFVIFLSVLVRLFLAAGSGLGIDESYMVAASTHFAASYFDHPLASWWLELAARHLFGASDPVVVRLPFVLLSAVSSWLLYLVTKRLFGVRAGFWAVVAYSISPVFSLAFGTWVLPDGPLNTALLAFIYALIRALGLPEGKPAPRWWLWAGLFAGLAMLSKYNAALVLVGAAVGVLLAPEWRKQLSSPFPWLGVALAVALTSPIVFWNIQYHWASFAYQSGRALGFRFRPLMPLSIWGGEALYVAPWLWVPMIWVMLRGFLAGSTDRSRWLLAWAAVIPVLLFAVVGLWSHTRILYHWAAPGYLMLFPLLGDWATRRSKALLSVIALLSATLLCFASVVLVGFAQGSEIGPLVTFYAPGKSPLLQIMDWSGIGRNVPKDVDAIAAQRWFDAGKVGYGLLLDGVHVPVTVFGDQPHEFAFSTPPASLMGKNVLVLAMPGSLAETKAKFAHDFKSFTPGPVLLVMRENRVFLVIPTFIGRDMVAVPKS